MGAARFTADQRTFYRVRHWRSARAHRAAVLAEDAAQPQVEGHT